jgi:hypothetical protein
MKIRYNDIVICIMLGELDEICVISVDRKSIL